MVRVRFDRGRVRLVGYGNTRTNIVRPLLKLGLIMCTPENRGARLDQAERSSL